MTIIEPCCAPRQINELRKTLGSAGHAEFRGYGDMSLTELLPALLTSYNETELMIAAPAIPDQAADILETWARWQWALMDGSGKIYALKKLTVIADLRRRKSPKASQWLKDNPFAGRLTLIDRPQPDTVILLPDFAITGPVNMQYGHQFTATAIAEPEQVSALWSRYAAMTEQEPPKSAIDSDAETG